MARRPQGAGIPPELFRQAIEAAHDGVVITDATADDSPIVYVNPAFERITGYAAAEVLGRNCRLLQGEDREQPERETIRRAIREGLPCLVVLKNYAKDGSLFWNELSLSPVRDPDGRITHFIGIQKDVTRRVKLQNAVEQQTRELEKANRALERLATRDALTDLANRRFLLEALEREGRRARREALPVSVILADIDFFKKYNDSMGHQAGDACLARVGAALESALRRPADLLARYGGEEFVALLPGTAAEGALQVAGSMRERVAALDLPHPAGAAGGRVSVSIGVASLAAGENLPGEALIARADEAMYRAKDAGRDRVEVWSPRPPAEAGLPRGPRTS